MKCKECPELVKTKEGDVLKRYDGSITTFLGNDRGKSIIIYVHGNRDPEKNIETMIDVMKKMKRVIMI